MKNLENFLNKSSEHYYINNNVQNIEKVDDLDTSDLVLYKVNSVTFKKDAPRREALENVLSALRIDGINFIYLILGDCNGVEFYYGITKDYTNPKDLEIDIDEIGKYILYPSMMGNFRGSKIDFVGEKEKRNILSKIRSNRYYSMVEGVPGVLEEKDNEFQGVDRLADVMNGDEEFGFMIISSLISDSELDRVRKNIFDLYDELVLIAKESKQESTGTSTSEANGTTNSDSKGVNKSTSKSESTSESRTETTSTSENETNGSSDTIGTNKGTNESSGGSYDSKGTSRGSNESKTTNYSKTQGGSTSQAVGKTIGSNINVTEGSNTNITSGTSQTITAGTNTGLAITKDYVKKQAQDWIKYIDDILLTRLDYGSGKGMFRNGMFCFSNSKAVLKKLENTIISLFSGETGNKVPLRAFLIKNDDILNVLKNIQLPKLKSSINLPEISSILSQNNSAFGNLISSKELSLIAGLPKKDIIGLELREEVEFGLNFDEIKETESKIDLGNLVQSGNETKKNVSINKKVLDKHIFVTGVTGSGKTTTCQNILEKSQLPFLVIEPAKTEYRVLKKKYSDLLIFTLGKDTISPFRLNPFEFFEGESITSRVDMIKASIETAFDMEAAIPQIIESAIYEAYKSKGWNINTNKNDKYENPFDDGVYSFPTLSDLFQKVDEVVEKQGFDIRLKQDYLGSIRARLEGLMLGSKGAMLNTKRSIDFRKLLNKRVVFELEEIRNGGEKSLIMGFILGNMLEAIKSNFKTRENKHDVNHIMLVEEAHRLLSKYEPGDSMNKKQGVEMFADMLAEIRKYGECLIIADQIPNKLTPEVLKNTNTKIVHKIFAEDDKRAIGNTMSLEKEQIEFLGNLETGRAIVFSEDFRKAISVQVYKSTDTKDNDVIDEKEIMDSALDFYATDAKLGAITYSNFIKNPTKKDIELLLNFHREEVIKKIGDPLNCDKPSEKMKELINMCKIFDIDSLTEIFLLEHNKANNKKDCIKQYLWKIMNESLTTNEARYFSDNITYQ
ncbi:MAG: DUF87 domain-containing protein [Campylobacter sp.]|uniref:helicase HerA domain-containing protein n=1 Tax=Campylobacter sp. TaxID=205 RepID=UPI002AA72D84|nr:DUF87 domain-containing protein [Campylobacter sp.]MCI7550277.1 DUF87 domain-containing protein [Campylobacter sp.]